MKRFLVTTLCVLMVGAGMVLASEASADGCPVTRCEPERVPRRLVVHDPRDCRDEVLYPGVKAKVHCVLVQNGMQWQIPTADYIVWRESRWQPGAYNGSCCYGLFQINVYAHPELFGRYGHWSDPVSNAAMAVAVYRKAGYSWRPWGL
jgi:hypothetical protein